MNHFDSAEIHVVVIVVVELPCFWIELKNEIQQNTNKKIKNKKRRYNLTINLLVDCLFCSQANTVNVNRLGRERLSISKGLSKRLNLDNC